MASILKITVIKWYLELQVIHLLPGGKQEGKGKRHISKVCFPETLANNFWFYLSAPDSMWLVLISAPSWDTQNMLQPLGWGAEAGAGRICVEIEVGSQAKGDQCLRTLLTETHVPTSI